MIIQYDSGILAVAICWQSDTVIVPIFAPNGHNTSQDLQLRELGIERFGMCWCEFLLQSEKI